jgi:hypothetical protein
MNREEQLLSAHIAADAGNPLQRSKAESAANPLPIWRKPRSDSNRPSF